MRSPAGHRGPSIAAVAIALTVACHRGAPPIVYEAVPVENRDIVVSAHAAGVIQPDTLVEVKSKASGEILELLVETGATVRRGDLMVRVDPRTVRNQMALAEADLEVAHAKMTNAEAQKRRADELFRSQSITETEHDSAILDYANAKAAVVGAEVALENARIQLEDSDVRAPITGTIIEKNVERGQVISSPSRDVGGGTVLLRMADLNLVQVRTMVDETDIGKIHPGLRATVTVDAYPNHPFEGEVLKIEPLATTLQNVTMFPVQVRIENREGLLRPGMNSEVEIHVGSRQGVLAIPNSSLRTERDVGSAAQVLGLDPGEVERELAANASTGSAPGAGNPGKPAGEPDEPGEPAGRPATEAGGGTMTTPDGRTIQLPPGVTEDQVRAVFRKMRGGGEPTAEERALMQKVRQAMGGSHSPGAGPRGSGGGGDAESAAGTAKSGMSEADLGGTYVVFALRGGKPVPVKVRTGLTDLDYSEVLEGLSAQDTVLVLPSASLVRSQEEFKERASRFAGATGMGMRQQTSGQSGGGGR